MKNDKTKANYVQIKTLKTFFENNGYVVEFNENLSKQFHYEHAFYSVKHKNLNCPSFVFSESDWGTNFSLYIENDNIKSGIPITSMCNIDDIKYFINKDKIQYNKLNSK